jgi:hypothetical protein
MGMLFFCLMRPFVSELGELQNKLLEMEAERRINQLDARYRSSRRRSRSTAIWNEWAIWPSTWRSDHTRFSAIRP